MTIQINLNRQTTPTQNLTNKDVREALRAFLVSLFPDIEVKRGQTNLKAPPKGAFIIFNAISSKRLSTNRRTYSIEDGTQNTIAPMECVYQIDFYGDLSGDRAYRFVTLFEDFNGFDSFPEAIKPLYCSDPMQMPLTSGEKAYQERWRVDAHIQFNAIVKSAMEFFENATVEIEQPF